MRTKRSHGTGWITVAGKNHLGIRPHRTHSAEQSHSVTTITPWACHDYVVRGVTQVVEGFAGVAHTVNPAVVPLQQSRYPLEHGGIFVEQ
jgi:hypothetical protein